MSSMNGMDSGMRVLIVDDNVDTARMMKELLDGAGFDARTVYDGEEALRVAGEFLPEVVFLDLALPGISGQVVAVEMRRLPALAGAMLVVVSGFNEDGVLPGFDHQVIKPVDPDALIALLALHDLKRGRMVA
jgi:two-component system, OmpR family, response regulator